MDGWRAIVSTKEMHRQVTRESRTDANSPGRIARCRISRNWVRRRLLLCRGAWLTVPLSLSANYSRPHSMKLYGMSFGKLMPPNAAPSLPSPISPVQALAELKRAIDLLDPVIAGPETVQALPRSRPVLRVIQGGLSSG